MDRIRMSLRVCQIRLRKIFTTPRFYVALLWIAILFHVMTVGIRGFCEQTGVDVTFWMLPFMTRYNGDQIIIVLGALLLFCDAPFLEPNSGWQILRAGRKSWFWGNMLYIVVVSFFYTICLSMIPVLLVFPNVGWETGWGKVISTLAQTNAAYTFDQEPLDYLILSRFSPQEAMGLTMLAIWCLSVMTGVVSYAGNFLVHRGFGIVINCGIALTALLLSKFSSITIGYYCAPPLWMNIASYKWQGYGNGPSMAYVYSVFAIVIGACTILSYLGIRKKDLNFVEEI